MTVVVLQSQFPLHDLICCCLKQNVLKQNVLNLHPQPLLMTLMQVLGHCVLGVIVGVDGLYRLPVAILLVVVVAMFGGRQSNDGDQ